LSPVEKRNQGGDEVVHYIENYISIEFDIGAVTLFAGNQAIKGHSRARCWRELSATC